MKPRQRRWGRWHYPLKLKDLIVMGVDHRRGPDEVAWGNDDLLVQRDLPSRGFAGDYFHGPANVSPTFTAWSEVVAHIDPSGRGEDETALGIGAYLHGMAYTLFSGGWRDGSSPATLKEIAEALVKYRVSAARVESNFGDGMFLQLLTPIVNKEWARANKKVAREAHGGTRLEEVRATRVQKELRMLSVLEPVTQSHRLVMSREVIEADDAALRTTDGEDTRHQYSLVYQLTHLTRERNSLAHDDRVEVLSGWLAHFAPRMGVDPIGLATARQDERIEDELEALFADADEVSGSHSRGPLGRSRNRARSAQPATRRLKPGHSMR